ncbi:Fc.00g033860.m01.CDS01 [Cosmosporella sp. VM-42]
MALETASAVAGFVSLGITVCDGLIKYYNQWSSYPEDVRDLMGDLARFIQFQEKFKAMIKAGAFQDELFLDIAIEVKSLGKAIEKLKKKLDKIKAFNTPTTFWGKASWHTRRMYYPFMESTITKLRESVEGAVDSIRTIVTVSTHKYNFTMSESLGEFFGTWTKSHLDSEHARVFDAIPTSLLRNKLQDCRNKRLVGTCQWILKDQTYVDWKNRVSQKLWIRGIGNIISNRRVREISLMETTADDICVLSHFFDSTEHGTSSLMALTASMIYQLCCQLGRQSATAILQDILSKMKYSYWKYRPTIQDLKDAADIAFKAAANSDKYLYIVVDGLDESDDLDQVLPWIGRTAILSTGMASWIFASRSLAKIEKSMKFSTKILSIDRDAIYGDIKTFVERQISAKTVLEGSDQDTQARVLKTLVEKSDGVLFTYVVCAIGILERCLCDADIDDVLQDMPSKIYGLYDDTLSRIERMHLPKAVTMLKWLMAAERPIRLAEMIEILLVESNGKSLRINPKRRMTEIQVLEICPALVTTHERIFWDPTTETEVRTRVLQLSHSSVKDYLSSEYIRSGRFRSFYLSGLMCQEHVVESCALFLIEQAKHDGVFDTYRVSEVNFPQTSSITAEDDHTFTYSVKANIGLRLEDIFDLYPLLAYALRYWPSHLGKLIAAKEAPPLELPAIMEVVQSELILTKCWTLFYPISNTPFIPIGGSLVGIYIPVDKNDPSITPMTYTSPDTTNDCVRYRQSNIAVTIPPLYSAIIFGWPPLVRWLLDNGFRYNGSQYTPPIPPPLHLAVTRGFHQIVSDLIERGYDTTEDTKSSLVAKTPFEVGILQGDPKMMAVLSSHLSPGDVFRNCSDRAMAISLLYGGLRSAETILSLLSAEFSVQWMRNAIDFALACEAVGDDITSSLIDLAKPMSQSGMITVSPFAVALSADKPRLMRKCLPLAPRLDAETMNTALNRLAMTFTDPRDLIDLTIAVLNKGEPGVILSTKVMGVFSLLGQPFATLALLTSIKGIPSEELHNFAENVDRSENQYPGLVESDYEKYPNITRLLMSFALEIDMSRDLACYLADWAVLRHSGTKPPVMVLNPPTILEWRTEVELGDLQVWGSRILTSQHYEKSSVQAREYLAYIMERLGINIISVNTIQPLFAQKPRWPFKPPPVVGNSLVDITDIAGLEQPYHCSRRTLSVWKFGDEEKPVSRIDVKRHLQLVSHLQLVRKV